MRLSRQGYEGRTDSIRDLIFYANNRADSPAFFNSVWAILLCLSPLRDALRPVAQ
jgi:hypothetical protein